MYADDIRFLEKEREWRLPDSLHSLFLKESHSPPSHAHFHHLYHCIHINIEHDTSMSYPTFYSKLLLASFTPTQAKLSIYILLIPFNSLPPHIIYSQHLPQSFPVNPTIHLLQIYKTYIYFACFFRSFSPICFSVKI